MIEASQGKISPEAGAEGDRLLADDPISDTIACEDFAPRLTCGWR